VKKINRAEIEKVLSTVEKVPSKDLSNDVANGLIINLLIEIHDVLIDLRGDVQDGQPVNILAEGFE
jgi:hypothetical protein